MLNRKKSKNKLPYYSRIQALTAVFDLTGIKSRPIHGKKLAEKIMDLLLRNRFLRTKI